MVLVGCMFWRPRTFVGCRLFVAGFVVGKLKYLVVATWFAGFG
jgi:hypothetical protein